MSRWLPLGLMVAGLFCLALGAWTLTSSRSERQQDVDLGTVPLGDIQELTVPIRNPERVRWRLIGSENSCGPDGTCAEAEGFPLTLPPGEEIRLPVKFAVSKPGPFRREFIVYREGGPSGRIAIVLKGVARPEQESHDTQLDSAP